MAAVLSLMTAKSAGAGVSAVMTVRAMEVLSVPSTSTIVAEDGEIAIILNTEASGILMATGSTPDAQATAATAATTAGQGVPSGLTSPAVLMNQGDKVSVKAIP